MAADFVSLPSDVGYDYTDPRSVGVRLEPSQDLPKSREASFVLDWGDLCWYLHRKPPIEKEQISLINLASSQPYITKAYFSLQNPPTKLVKIAIGDGAIDDYTEYTYAPVVQIIETFPQIIGYDSEVFNYFTTQYDVRSVVVEMSADTGTGRTYADTISISHTRRQEASSRR
jgi:hypothetical protein